MHHPARIARRLRRAAAARRGCAAGAALLSLMWTACAQLPLGAGPRPAWNDIEVIRENVEAPRAHFVGYPSREAAIARGANDRFQSLNGLWRFHYSAAPAGQT